MIEMIDFAPPEFYNIRSEKVQFEALERVKSWRIDGDDGEH